MRTAMLIILMIVFVLGVLGIFGEKDQSKVKELGTASTVSLAAWVILWIWGR